MRHTIIAVSLLFVVGCASTGTTLRRQSAVVLAASEQALTNLRTAEAALYAQGLPAWSATQHQQFLAGLKTAQTAIKTVASSLAVWQVGDPLPATLVGYRTALQQLWTLISGTPLAGKAAQVLVPLQAALDAVQTLIANFGGA